MTEPGSIQQQTPPAIANNNTTGAFSHYRDPDQEMSDSSVEGPSRAATPAPIQQPLAEPLTGCRVSNNRACSVPLPFSPPVKTRHATDSSATLNERTKVRLLSSASRDDLDLERHRRKEAQARVRVEKGQKNHLNEKVSMLRALVDHLRTDNQNLNKRLIEEEASALEMGAAFKTQIEERARNVMDSNEDLNRLNRDYQEALQSKAELEREVLSLKNNQRRDQQHSSSAAPPQSAGPRPPVQPEPPIHDFDSLFTHLKKHIDDTISNALSPPNPNTANNSNSSSSGSSTSSTAPNPTSTPLDASARDAGPSSSAPNMSNSPTATPISSPKKHLKSGSSAHWAELRREVKGILSPKELSTLRGHVRFIFKAVTKMPGINKFTRYTHADPDVVRAFHDGIDNFQGPRSEEYRFRLYFGDDWKTCLWNQVVVNNMVTKAIAEFEIELYPGSSPQSDQTRAHLIAVFWGNIKQAQESWAKCQSRVDPVSGELESPQETQSRVIQQFSGRKRACMLRSRKERKHKERIKAVRRKLAYLQRSDTETLRWQAMETLLETLGINGQSTDEDADEHPCLQNRTISAWRRRGITALMTEVDKELGRQLLFSRNRDKAQKIRKPSDIPSVRDTVPLSRPVDFYRRSFIKQQTPADLARLNLDTKAKPHPLLLLFPSSDTEDELEMEQDSGANQEGGMNQDES
ncbi:hypothetical protein V5O48_011510 [Marasmius crinis-equi]|uniref:BZIP domain-containing protein n=1 Tax=Marasmius crinis-equi TaxID=585013 RepID=A0ABR3F5I2_9AGAR